MKIMVNGDTRVIGMIKNKPYPERLYRLSHYTFFYHEADSYLVKNTLTGMVVLLSETEAAYIESLRTACVNGTQLLDRGLEELVSFGFFVEKETNEYVQYQQVVELLRLLSTEMPGTKNYTILPTLACNARCVYCYEEGLQTVVMEEKTADRVVAFIEKTRRADTITLIWFGGEPLAGRSVISQICRQLEQREIPFRSKIVTNATLLTPQILEEAISLWHLESAQVSVDGERKDYEARKKYLNPKIHHYDAMMNAVGLLLDRGIRVSLRCNYDDKNIDGLKLFIDDLTGRFGCPENLSFYPAMLFQVHSGERGVELQRKIQAVNSYLLELGLKRAKKDQDKLKCNFCEADCGEKSVVIAPDGRLYHCEHLPGNTDFGSIWDENPAVCSDPRAELPADEACQTCCFLPICTPFYKNGCADYTSNCRSFRQIETEAALSRIQREMAAPAEAEKGNSVEGPETMFSA